MEGGIFVWVLFFAFCLLQEHLGGMLCVVENDSFEEKQLSTTVRMIKGLIGDFLRF